MEALALKPQRQLNEGAVNGRDCWLKGEARDADGGMGRTAEKKMLDSKNIEK
jgi:hypothetical protein